MGHEAKKRMILRGLSSDRFFPVESSSRKKVGWKVEGRDKTGSVGNGAKRRDKGEGKILMRAAGGGKRKENESIVRDGRRGDGCVWTGSLEWQPPVPASQAKVTVQPTRGSTVKTRGSPSAVSACSSTIPYGVQCLAVLILLDTWACLGHPSLGLLGRVLDAAGVRPQTPISTRVTLPQRSSGLACANLSSEACLASHSLFHRACSQVCGLSSALDRDESHPKR